MRGTYIASQLNEDNSIHSVITFNRGAQWQPVPKPEEIVCKDNAEVTFWLCLSIVFSLVFSVRVSNDCLWYVDASTCL